MRLSPFVRGMLVLAAIAVVIFLLNLETALSTVALLVRLAFILAIALVVYLLWRDFGRREIGLWETRRQWVFYGAAGLLVADIGWWFFGGLSGPNALVFFVVAAVCVFVGVRTWREQHRYS